MEALIVPMQRWKSSESNLVDHQMMAFHPYLQGVANRAKSHIHADRRGTGSDAVSLVAFWLQHLARRHQALRNETQDRSIPCRKSLRPESHRCFAASHRNDLDPQLLLNASLQNLPKTYLWALNRASISATSKPRACKLYLSLRRAS
jgi:hypothetical protein